MLQRGAVLPDLGAMNAAPPGLPGREQGRAGGRMAGLEVAEQQPGD